jgi:HD-GYP domain-containing protein (c-di-GMP phosphodiesterase class II)
MRSGTAAAIPPVWPARRSPIAGRIVAVADVFDALTHERPYKAAWSTAEALAEMTSQAARHFDPAVLAAFLGLELAAAAA